MCLIAFSKEGKPLARNVFDVARWTNADGIGVMSQHGIEKFVGRKHGKRAWRYLQTIPEGTPHAVHFRYATHGSICRALTHPFRAPGASETYVMHNGILQKTAKFVRKGAVSDTSLYVAWHMKDPPAPGMSEYPAFKERLEKELGYCNKMVLYHKDANAWTIANEEDGTWIDGIWYSNEYSLPDSILPARPTRAYGWYAKSYEKWWDDALSPDTREWMQEQNWYTTEKEKALLSSGPTLGES